MSVQLLLDVRNKRCSFKSSSSQLNEQKINRLVCRKTVKAAVSEDVFHYKQRVLWLCEWRKKERVLA